MQVKFRYVFLFNDRSFARFRILIRILILIVSRNDYKTLVSFYSICTNLIGRSFQEEYLVPIICFKQTTIVKHFHIEFSKFILRYAEVCGCGLFTIKKLVSV